MPLPVRVHPANPHLFEFRGKPLVLVTACEHYGVMNRPFRFERYLTDTTEVGINYTRLFTLFRELQSAANPYSTCKPESTDYIAPFERVGRERALDLQPKYDLDRWNPVTLKVPTGDHLLSCFCPLTGLSSPEIKVAVKEETLQFTLAAFEQDIVVRLRRSGRTA